MTKHTVPSLAMVLALAVAASSPAFASRESITQVPEVITVSDVSIRTDEELTEIRVQGDFPLNYLVFQPEPNKLVVEVRDCDSSSIRSAWDLDSQQVQDFSISNDIDVEGTKISRFTTTTFSGVSHVVTPQGNDLVLRFVSGGNAQKAATKASTSTSAAVAPVRNTSTAKRAVDASGLIGYSETDARSFADLAGMPAFPAARALVGIDTAGSDIGKVVLLLDGPASFSSFELTDPPRLVVDFDGLANDVLVDTIPVDSPFLHRVRVSQFKDEPESVARAVLDLSRPAAYDIQPSPEGLEILFSKASMPAPVEMQMAQDTVAIQPVETEAVQEEPVTTAMVAQGMSDRVAETAADFFPAEAALEAPAEEIEAETQEETVVPDMAEYAFYSEAPPISESNSGIKPGVGLTYESKTISDDRPLYSGRRISLELVDADLKQVFRLFHEISGLNFVLDPSVSGKVTIVLDNVPWDQALDIILRNNGLDKIFENNVVRIATTAKLATEAQQRRALKEASRLEVDPITVSRILSYAKAEEADPIVRRILSSRGQAFFDKRTNTIIVSDIPEKIAAINTLLDDLDARTPQVMIEARIVETSREFTRDLGIDWGFLGNEQRGAGNSFSYSWDLNLPRVANASQLGIIFGDAGPDGFVIDLAIDALETEGRARVLSAPKVMAQNNTTAVIEQGVQIPVVNTTATEINVEFISASLKLEVTPQITAEGTVIMDIQVDNSSPDFNNRVGDTPAINTERAATRVLVEDGGTTVIGGVFLLNEGESETGVPILRKIPGLGWLFKNKNITKQNRELLIFITPRITL